MLYVPRAFAESEAARLHALIETNSFATLVSPDARDPWVSHLPLLLDAGAAPHGVLLGHMARGNPHWRRMQEQPVVLSIFHGPHAYVSPSLYGTHPSVPTWNYATVHVRGRARLLHGAVELERLVGRLVHYFEGARAEPWRMQLPAEYQAQMLNGIVGFEIEIEEMMGKFKLSQNRPEEDRQRVQQAFTAGSAVEQAVAALMRTMPGNRAV
jgi:transcriptional regulator